MTSGKSLIILVIYFAVGACVGYLLFSSFPELLLPGIPDKHTLVSTEPYEITLTQVLFSFFCGIAFLSVPFATLVSVNSFKINRFTLLLIAFQTFMLAASYAAIVFYIYSFTQMFDATQAAAGLTLPLSIIPYYKLPIFVAAVTVCASLLFLPFRKKH